MLYLRVVRNHNAFIPPISDIEKAVNALTDDEDRLSVYLVQDGVAAIRLATLYAMHAKPAPEKISYILIPRELLAAVGAIVTANAGDIDHPFLQQSHHEVSGLGDASKRLQLAIAISQIAPPTAIGGRLMPSAPNDAIDLRRSGIAEIADPQTGAKALALVQMKPKWLTLLGR